MFLAEIRHSWRNTRHSQHRCCLGWELELAALLEFQKLAWLELGFTRDVEGRLGPCQRANAYYIPSCITAVEVGLSMDDPTLQPGDALQEFSEFVRQSFLYVHVF